MTVRNAKPKNIPVVRSTLDQKHTERLEHLDKLQGSLPQKKKLLKTLQNELSELNEIGRPNIKTNTKKSQINDRIKNLKKEISAIEKCDESLCYISNVLPYLINYYEGNVTDSQEFSESEKEFDKSNVMSYISKPKKTTPIKPQNKSIYQSKIKIYDNYMSTIDPIHRINAQPKNSTKCSIQTCTGTKSLSYNDSTMVCDECGYSEKIFIPVDKPKFKEFNQDCTYAYKRINHLTEILSQLQARESTDISDNVFGMINKELKKRRIRKDELDIFKLRKILKRLGFRKYYEHVSHILQIINGKEPPNFTRRDEMEIKKRFKEIQKPFLLFRPSNRKNFLNYSYVIRKICELIGLRSYVNYFPLLKNTNKLREHDRIWKKICIYLRWQFYKSI